ncbi:DsbA family oxidoreductase [Streptomyces sp. NPDC002057]|uniref:DsbA family oxidoreductase n=1 Tax=Streptomyces sp. NPDC002057 TaxID=3154664 RepID=UPI00331C9E2B
MKVEMYGDVLCPWCYIGKRRVEAAVRQLADSSRVEVVWRSYELAPDEGRTPGPTAAEAMTAWWGDRAPERVSRIQEEGRREGLELNLHLARPVSTFDAHRLLHLAAERGLSDAVLEGLLRAYHTEGRNIADPQVLERVGVAAGLPSDEVRAALAGDAFAEDVRADERRAAALGIAGVPSLVVDGGPPTSGIQSPARLRALLEDALAASHDPGRQDRHDRLPGSSTPRG